MAKGYDAEVHRDLILVEPDLDTGTLILVPGEWWDDADWYDCHNTARCLKITAIYQQLAARRQVPPPRFLNYITSDPWTRLPLFKKPAVVACMDTFLGEYAS